MFKNKLNIWSDFNKNVVTLFIGTTLAQGIPLIFSPLLTRIFEPEQYGVFALFFAITNVLGIVATGRYEMAIVLPKEEAEADHLQRLCYFISAAVGVVLLIMIMIFEAPILRWLDAPGFSIWLYLIPLNVALMGILQAISFRLNRMRRFRQMSLVKIIQNSTNVLFSLLLGAASLLKNGLIIGHLMGFLVAVVIFVGRTGIKATHSLGRLREVARRYSQFVTYNAPTALLNTLASALPLFYISRIASKTELGFYGLVERVINAPIGLIAYSVSQVLLEDVASRHKEGRPIRKVLFQLLGNLFLIGIIPFSILFLFAEEIFQYVFGPAWRDAGRYASILSIAFFMRFMVSPLSVVFISLNQLKRLTLWQTLYFCSTMVVLLLSYARVSVEQFLIFIVINDLIMYSVYIYLIQSIVKK